MTHKKKTITKTNDLKNVLSQTIIKHLFLILADTPFQSRNLLNVKT